MNLPGISRKNVGEKLGVGEKQVGRYIKLASKHLHLFSDFIDPETENLNGTPIETQGQVEILQEIQKLIKKYKNTKNRSEIIAEKLNELNKELSKEDEQ